MAGEHRLSHFITRKALCLSLECDFQRVLVKLIFNVKHSKQSDVGGFGSGVATRFGLGLYVWSDWNRNYLRNSYESCFVCALDAHSLRTTLDSGSPRLILSICAMVE